MKLFLFVVIAVFQICTGCELFSPAECPTATRNEYCTCNRLNQNAILCCHVDSEFKLKEGLACAGLVSNTTKHVLIYNATLEKFDAESGPWSQLESITITASKLKTLNTDFLGNFTCLNFSGNALSDITSSAFSHLTKLRTLDLSRNNLTSLPDLKNQSKGNGNFSLDISGNKLMLCHSLKSLIEESNSSNFHFLNYNATTCLASRSFHWFNSTEMVPLAQMEMLTQLEQECPKGPNFECSCNPYTVDLLPGKPPTFTVRVLCPAQHLTELPHQLPPNTIYLDVSDNNITSLDPFVSDPSYHDIRILIADNNKIDSITSLERSRFIHNFVILSIRANKLKTLPTYVLSNTFDRNWLAKRVKLGKNKFNCDCQALIGLKQFFLQNKVHVPDYDEVLCDTDERVINVDQSKVCVYEKDWTDYIYYIIAGEVLLLVLLISKVSYDYWVFKTSGYLPWPASKMPKLPCDWVFES